MPHILLYLTSLLACVLSCLTQHVPYVLSCLTCFVPDVLRRMTCLMFSVSTCLMCHVPYLLLCLTCIMPYILSYLTCLVPLVFSCSMCGSTLIHLMSCSSRVLLLLCFWYSSYLIFLQLELWYLTITMVSKFYWKIHNFLYPEIRMKDFNFPRKHVLSDKC